MVTQNMQFAGTVAEIKIRGRIGLVAKDYDLQVGVTPHMTSSLPVVAAIATANPLAGVAAWVVNRIMNPEVSKIVTSQWYVTGTWEKPVWKNGK